MCTGEDVFRAALAVLDELEGGSPDRIYSGEYKERSLPILNAVTAELMTGLGRGEDYVPVWDFAGPLPLPDSMCRSVLPYGLAANLAVSDDPDSAAFCRERYEEMKRELLKHSPAESRDTEDVYGGIGFGEFSRW